MERARYFALACGVIFALAGVAGFIPIITPPVEADAPRLVIATGYGYLLGLFPVNLLHDLVHLTISVSGFLAFRSQAAARSFARALAIFLGLLALMGLSPALRTVFGFIPLYSHDIWLHGVEAAIAGYFGFVTPTEPTSAKSATGDDLNR